MQRVEARFGRPIDEVLRDFYVDQGLNLEQLGRELGITKSAASRWLAHFRIPARKPGARPEGVE
jgi:hypothetical protein